MRRVLLLPVFCLAWAGLSSVLLCSAAEIRFTTQKTYNRSLQSRVPTMGRCPLTPSVAASVGTIGKRASSWLKRTISTCCAFFQRGDILLSLRLLVGVAAQVTVGRAVQADTDLLAEPLDGGTRGLDALGLLQVVGEFFVSPIG